MEGKLLTKNRSNDSDTRERAPGESLVANKGNETRGSHVTTPKAREEERGILGEEAHSLGPYNPAPDPESSLEISHETEFDGVLAGDLLGEIGHWLLAEDIMRLSATCKKLQVAVRRCSFPHTIWPCKVESLPNWINPHWHIRFRYRSNSKPSMNHMWHWVRQCDSALLTMNKRPRLSSGSMLRSEAILTHGMYFTRDGVVRTRVDLHRSSWRNHPADRCFLLKGIRVPLFVRLNHGLTAIYSQTWFSNSSVRSSVLSLVDGFRVKQTHGETTSRIYSMANQRSDNVCFSGEPPLLEIPLGHPDIAPELGLGLHVSRRNHLCLDLRYEVDGVFGVAPDKTETGTPKVSIMVELLYEPCSFHGESPVSLATPYILYKPNLGFTVELSPIDGDLWIFKVPMRTFMAYRDPFFAVRLICEIEEEQQGSDSSLKSDYALADVYLEDKDERMVFSFQQQVRHTPRPPGFRLELISVKEIHEDFVSLLFGPTKLVVALQPTARPDKPSRVVQVWLHVDALDCFVHT